MTLTPEKMAHRVASLEKTVSELQNRLLLKNKIIESSRDAIFISREDAKFTLVNEAACRMTGYSREELLEMKIPELHDEIDLHAFQQFHNRIFAGEEITSEAQILRKDGQKTNAEFSNGVFYIGDAPFMHTIARDLTDRKRNDKLLRMIVESTSAVTGEDFFRSLVKHLAIALEVRCTFIAACVDAAKEKVRTLAFWHGADYAANIEYELQDTPSRLVIDGKPCFFRENVQEIFPDDSDLTKLNAQSYLGVPIFDSRREIIGHLALLHDKPLNEEAARVSVLHILAARAGAEMERITAERKLKEHEQKLKLSEEHYRTFFDNSLVGIYRSTHEGNFTLVNPAFVKMLGYDSAEELMRIDINSELYPDSENRTKLHEQYDEAGLVSALEYKFKRKDGKIIDVSSYCREIKDRHNRTVAHEGIVLDITIRKRALNELQKLAILVESSNEIIAVANMKGEVEYVNKTGRKLLGLENVSNTLIMDFHPESERARISNEILPMLQSKGVWEGEVQFQHFKTNENIPCDMNAFVIYAQGSEAPLSIATVSRDLRERKKAEDEREKLTLQMQHTQKLKSLGVLAGGIAHDFNNLLTGMIGNASLAQYELSEGSPTISYLKAIEKSAQQAAELCRQMLAYSGKGRFMVQPLNISRVMREISHLLEVSISKKAILNYDFMPIVPTIEADPSQIKQIIMNLIINASEALDEKSGAVRISTGAVECSRDDLLNTYLDDDLPEGLYVYFEVEDTGCGMDDETMGKIFDPFFSTKFTGRGLGLAAVLGIVRGHKGAIKIDSKPGRGTKVRVLFPASREKEFQDAGALEPPVNVWRGSGSILVIDDDETVRAVSRKMLEKIGFSVITAFDGEDGLQRFVEHRDAIRLVLLDLTMPRLSGEETFRAMRRVRDDLPIVLLSGYSEHEITPRFEGKGLAGFLQKPFDTPRLTQIVKKALSLESECNDLSVQS